MRSLSRRDLLRGAAGLAAGVALARPAWAATDAAWADLARRFGARLLRPGDAGLVANAQSWNLRVPVVLPEGIVRCTSTEDVVAAIRWARDTATPFVARSGGHSYSGFSQTTGLLIDVSPMNSVTFDPATGRTRVAGGANNGQVFTALQSYGTAITHGRCYGVGVAGLALGGGIGFDMRERGLTCDRMVATEMVTATGEVLSLSDRENADLFWAVRGGGGGNFGIHTAFTFDTFTVKDVTAFTITWTDRLDALLPVIQEAMIRAPRSFGVKLSVVTAPGPGGHVQSITLLGQVAEEYLPELFAIVQPIYRVAMPSQQTIKTLSYWDGQTFLSESSANDYSYERSQYVYGAIPPAGLTTILRTMREFPGPTGMATWKAFLTGGAVDDIARTETAFVHRGASMISSVELNWVASDHPADVARQEAWLDRFHEAMRGYTSSEAYQNFIDGHETDWATAYYAENLPRLSRIKRAIDPDNVFRYPQSIPLA